MYMRFDFAEMVGTAFVKVVIVVLLLAGTPINFERVVTGKTSSTEGGF
jgi:cytochrome c oxidase assembly factor CtaG